MNKNSISSSFGDRALSVFAVAVSGIFAILCVFPFILVVATSLTDEVTLLREGYKLIPEKFSFSAYQAIFSSSSLVNSYLVTIFVTVVGTVLSMLVTSAAAYAVSVKDLKYRNGIVFYVWITMLFSGGLVPWYILISKYLHLSDSIWVMIVPALVNPWYMFLMRNFFKTIPDSLSESAKIDGANDMFILFRIILPLSLPAIATVGLFYSLDYWNEWFRALMFIENPKLYPLQFIIMRIISSMSFTSQLYSKSGASITLPTYTIRMATVIVTIGPIVLLYPFVQKYFVKGLMVGAIKG